VDRDPVAGALVSLLRERGAAAAAHGRGRTLLDHLIGTAEIVRRWGQPPLLQHASLLHSVYGTDAYAPALLAEPDRETVRRLAGADAERLAYLFGATPRGPLLAGTLGWAGGQSTGAGAGGGAGRDRPTEAELDALVLLHMANLAEQSAAPDGAPGPWLATVRDYAERLPNSSAIDPPAFLDAVGELTADDEAVARRMYASALHAPAGSAERSGALALISARWPALPEPCAWLAHGARDRGDTAQARAWAALARDRLSELGTPWDKRLGFDEWARLIAALGRRDGGDGRGGGSTRAGAGDVGDPRALYDAVVAGQPVRGRPRAARTGRERFRRYVESFAATGGAATSTPICGLSRSTTRPSSRSPPISRRTSTRSAASSPRSIQPRSTPRANRFGAPGAGMWRSSTSGGGATTGSAAPVR